MKTNITYAGFWVRSFAAFFDTFFLALPVAILIYFLSDGTWFELSKLQQNIQYALSGNAQKALSLQLQTTLHWELLFECIVLVLTAIFWRYFKGATPGKKYMGIKVVDAHTLNDIDNRQVLTRSFGYIASILFFFIGFFMIAFRKDKRGLHDLLANTVVIYETDR